MLDGEFAKCDSKLKAAEPRAKLAEAGSKVALEFKDIKREHEIASEAIKMAREMREGAEKELSEIKAQLAKIAPSAISFIETAKIEEPIKMPAVADDTKGLKLRGMQKTMENAKKALDEDPKNPTKMMMLELAQERVANATKEMETDHQLPKMPELSLENAELVSNMRSQ